MMPLASANKLDSALGLQRPAFRVQPENAGGNLLITAKSCQLLQVGPKSLCNARKKLHSEGRQESMGIIRGLASAGKTTCGNARVTVARDCAPIPGGAIRGRRGTATRESRLIKASGMDCYAHGARAVGSARHQMAAG